MSLINHERTYKYSEDEFKRNLGLGPNERLERVSITDEGVLVTTKEGEEVREETKEGYTPKRRSY